MKYSFYLLIFLQISFFISCGKNEEKITAYILTTDLKAGTILKNTHIIETIVEGTEFALSGDLRESLVQRGDIKAYIGKKVKLNLKANQLLYKHYFKE